jgi:acyl-CoA hydrolase
VRSIGILFGGIALAFMIKVGYARAIVVVVIDGVLEIV